MEQYTFDLLGSKSDYVCEDKEYEVIYEVEGREIIVEQSLIRLLAGFGGRNCINRVFEKFQERIKIKQ